MRKEGDPGPADGRAHPPDWKKTSEGPSGKLIGAGVAAGLLLVFVLQNTDRADVDFLIWDGAFPLWLLIVISAVLGFAGGWFLGRLRGANRRAARAEKRADKNDD